MKKNKYVTESFINAITKEVSILIAANDHMSIEKAENLFKESKVYNFLCFPPDYFYEEDPQYFYEIFNHHKSNSILSSAILSKITDITNKYLADKRIYIPGITPKLYYHLSRGYGKSIRELCYFMKLISDSNKSQFSYNPYSSEYTVQNYKSDMENLYKKIFSQKILNLYTTQNNSVKQRNNNQEEMSCLKLIADKNNANKKFHK